MGSASVGHLTVLVGGVLLLGLVSLLLGGRIKYAELEIGPIALRPLVKQGPSNSTHRRKWTLFRRDVRLATMIDGDLGKGLAIGGEHMGRKLVVAATEWAEFDGVGWVRTGLFYREDRSPAEAVAFFKVHANRDGAGYIHLSSVANPTHTLWLALNGQPVRRETFVWSDDASATNQRSTWWHFMWHNVG